MQKETLRGGVWIGRKSDTADHASFGRVKLEGQVNGCDAPAKWRVVFEINGLGECLGAGLVHHGILLALG